MRKHRSHKFTTQVTQIFLVSCVLCLVSYLSYAEPVSSTELIEKAKEYNNKVVEFQGEVIGDIMPRGDFAWVNINDGKRAIGVFGMKDRILSVVGNKGDYKHKGDTVLVRGVFHRACPEHGGDLDIHLQDIIKIRSGFCVPHQLGVSKMIYAFWLSIAALGLAILAALKAKKGS